MVAQDYDRVDEGLHHDILKTIGGPLGFLLRPPKQRAGVQVLAMRAPRIDTLRLVGEDHGE